MKNEKIHVQTFIKTKTNNSRKFSLKTRGGFSIDLSDYLLENSRLFLKIRKLKQNTRTKDEWDKEFNLDIYSATGGIVEWIYSDVDTNLPEGVYECEIEGHADLVNGVYVIGTSSRKKFPENENQFIYIEFQKGSN